MNRCDSLVATAPPRVRLDRWALGLLLVGILWRTVRYLLSFPIWGDEAMVCLNFIDQDFVRILGPLYCKQIGPMLFWWSQLLAYKTLGSSELAVRLLPFLAGVGGLLLVARLAWLLLPPLARTLAIGFLAVAIWPVSMSTFAKPYALDLFCPALLLVLASEWRRRPERVIWLTALAIAAPVAILSSFTSIFVAGAISLALLPDLRRSGWSARRLFVALNLLVAGSFLFGLRISESQLDPNDTVIRPFLHLYWADAFPPAQPVEFVKWFALIHTGRMMAYPVGGSNGASALTFLLFLCGAAAMWRRRQRATLVLLTAPFAFGLIAAALDRYPYGGCCRISQFLAPSICVLAGLGAAALIERSRSDAARRKWTIGVLALFVCIGIGGMTRDILRPYRNPTDQWMRQTVSDFIQSTDVGDPIVSLNRDSTREAVVDWYLITSPRHVDWSGLIDANQVRGGKVWCFHFRISDDLEALRRFDPAELAEFSEFRRQLDAGPTRWKIARHVESFWPGRKGDFSLRFDAYCWVPIESTSPAAPNLGSAAATARIDEQRR